MSEIIGGYYNTLSDKQKEVASKIEKLLEGLSVHDADRLLEKVKRSINDNTIIKSDY